MWRQRSLALCSSTREGQVGLPSCDVLMPGAAEEGEALLKPLSGRGPSLTLILSFSYYLESSHCGPGLVCALPCKSQLSWELWPRGQD